MSCPPSLSSLSSVVRSSVCLLLDLSENKKNTNNTTLTQHYSFMLMIDNAILNYLEFACCSMLVLFLKRNQMFCVFRDKQPRLLSCPDMHADAACCTDDDS